VRRLLGEEQEEEEEEDFFVFNDIGGTQNVCG
jgi:hypothetical protein